MRHVFTLAFASVTALSSLLSIADVSAAGQPSSPIHAGNWLTVAANVDSGYRSTQFFEPDYDTALLQWDCRVDIWLPPFRDAFAWGPYVRLAGVTSSRVQPWENAWLSAPGVGLQMYPGSLHALRDSDSFVVRWLGPMRVFAEYNAVSYWGAENTWRPDRQTRTGIDYWKAVNVNDLTRPWWLEIWNGLYWQSSNEFTDDYKTLVLANATRIGVRKTNSRVSSLTPYLAIESSRTPNDEYDWENRLLIGGGVRIAPALGDRATSGWLSRFVIYGEALKSAAYYVPRTHPFPAVDVRVGVSTSIGDWYK